MLRFGIRWGMAITLVLLVMVTDGHAKRLLETDGIELRGTARVVTYGAAVCNVLEEKYTEQEYEKLKANHGQPLNVWQLDFSVYNGSGKWLDHLIARYGIESKWPPCTNWSGDGPGGGPSGTYSGPVEWASTIGHIQKSGRNVVAPDEILTETRYIIVLRGDPDPRFSNWSVDFDFALNPPPAGTAATSSAASAAGQPPAAAATPEQENLFWQSIMNSTAAADFEAYLRQFPNGIFRVLAQNRLAALRGSASRVESRAPQPPRQAEQGRPSGISAGQTCAGKEGGTACWMELSSHPGCYVRAFRFYPDRPLAWSAKCSGGLASGTGTLTWIREGSDIEESGLLRNGKPEGRWVKRYSRGRVQEGAFVDGKREGKWTLQWGDEGSGEEWYVNGKRHGRYVTRYPDGSGEEGMYVDGERHGRWIVYRANKEPAGGVYEQGAKQGEWVEHYGYQTRRGPYVDGEEHGEWVERWGSDVVHRGPYVDGEKHGRWVERDGDIVGEGPYVEGKQTGPWVIRDEKDGTIEEGSYVDRLRVGRWVTRRADGTVVKVENWRHGEERQPDGSVWKGYYVNGEKHGLWSREGADGELLGEDLYHQGELRRRFY